ncbi:hypothetical protein LOK49_LG07G01494 [Camellia lanceoleosa]|uniref:Uncharacterized protein n=1 Tax=Camellia lanceoleosa TaxID=1840588 RepID=A0ACC0H806_9ERIC|nr:hypothetical protein LOK49_LG07G01494 [Camellia lanceoleosa]
MTRGAKVSRIKGLTSVGSWHRTAWCRATMVALSSSSSTTNQRERWLLNEADAAVQLGKHFGLDCSGKELEVLAQCTELELKDAELVVGCGGSDYS